jgi:hypothetical protein
MSVAVQVADPSGASESRRLRVVAKVQAAVEYVTPHLFPGSVFRDESWPLDAQRCDFPLAPQPDANGGSENYAEGENSPYEDLPTEGRARRTRDIWGLAAIRPALPRSAFFAVAERISRIHCDERGGSDRSQSVSPGSVTHRWEAGNRG